MRRADVPIGVRKRIVDVESGAYVPVIVAIRAPDQEKPKVSLAKAPSVSFCTFLQSIFIFTFYAGAFPRSPRRLRRFRVFISKRRADVPIGARKRIVDVESGSYVPVMAATRAPEQEVQLRRTKPTTMREKRGFRTAYDDRKSSVLRHFYF